jgi:hypothetical protein
LAARIADLRDDGMIIKSKTITKGKKHFTQYYL